MAKRCKEGLLFKRSDGILKDWKQYEFKLSQTYFHYFQVSEGKSSTVLTPVVLSCMSDANISTFYGPRHIVESISLRLNSVFNRY